MAARVAVAGDAVNAVPNAHAILVHFPLGLLSTAVVADLVGAVFLKRPGLNRTALWLWVGGTGLLVATYLTGRDAAADVRTPGMAHALINAHWTWAWYTVPYFGAVMIGRIGLRWIRSEPRPGTHRRVARRGAGAVSSAADCRSRRPVRLSARRRCGGAVAGASTEPLNTEHAPRK